jgi:hypothetical protein
VGLAAANVADFSVLTPRQAKHQIQTCCVGWRVYYNLATAPSACKVHMRQQCL